MLTDFVLRKIDMIFESGGLEPCTGFEPQVSGQRRGLVEAYYANIDFRSAAAVRKLLVAYEELIERLRQAQDRVTNPSKWRLRSKGSCAGWNATASVSGTAASFPMLWILQLSKRHPSCN